MLIKFEESWNFMYAYLHGEKGSEISERKNGSEILD